MIEKVVKQTVLITGMFAAVSSFGGASETRRAFACYRSFLPELERTADFAEMGIPIRCFFAANTINGLGDPYCKYPLIWKGFKKYDWTALDAQIEDLLEASPKAEFLCIVDLNTPYWATHKFWLDSFTDLTHAASDPRWIKRTTEWMQDFIVYAEKRWGSCIRGYILSGGGASEWKEWDRGRTSYSKNAAWVKWCRARGLKYGSTVPNIDSLKSASFENLVYDPAKERVKIDYWRFHNSLISDAILAYASACRKLLPKDKEIGVFFGYYHVSTSKQSSYGHLDYERVIASPDIDFFIAPGNYSERRVGGGSGSQLIPASVRLHGKRFLHEIDFWPHSLKRPQKNLGGYFKTAADDLAGNTREAAFAIANGASYWWFDMFGGFYDDPVLRRRISKLAEITRRYEKIIPKPVDEVLLVADPDSIYYINEKDPKQRAFGEYFRNALSKTGIPFDVCTLSDLKTRDISKTKVVVFPAAVCITPEKKALIDKTILCDGKTVVWCYAPGLCDGRTLDPGRVKEYAGVPYAAPGVSTVRMDNWTSVYAHDCKKYTPRRLREIIAAAGAHVWTSRPVVTFANERFFAIHTAQGGKVTVHLPRKTRQVVDLLDDSIVAKETDSFEVELKSPDTRLFEY